jgi:hypothetical protein
MGTKGRTVDRCLWSEPAGGREARSGGGGREERAGFAEVREGGFLCARRWAGLGQPTALSSDRKRATCLGPNHQIAG